MINIVFGKTMENLRKHRNIKFVTTERRRNYLASELNYHNMIFFTENLLAKEMWKTQILMNKTIYLGLSILDLSKTAMYEFFLIMQNQNMVQMQKFVIWIQSASMFI